MPRFYDRWYANTRSFMGSGIITCFFGTKKYMPVAYGGLVVMMALLGANVWGAAFFAEVVNTHGNMLQNSTTHAEYMGILVKVFCINMIIFFLTDNIVYYVKLYWGIHWRRAMRGWYRRKVVGKQQKIKGISQIIIDRPKEIVEKTVDLGINLFRSAIALCVFVPMVADMSQYFDPMAYSLMLKYLPFAIYIKWTLLWILLIVFIVEWRISYWLGRPLPDIESARQQTTATARLKIERMHENDVTSSLFPIMRKEHLYRRSRQSIVLLFKRELKQLNRAYPLVLWKSFYSGMWSIWPMLGLGYFVAVLVSIPLGIMSQTMAAINEVHRALATLPDSWQVITEIQGSVKKLLEIEKE
jgi:ABC-type long-subunit fatty acid transport system fused permease/ATPase subunit